MAIKDWPKDERPREKFLQYGATVLSDAELLAIFFCTLASQEYQQFNWHANYSINLAV